MMDDPLVHEKYIFNMKRKTMTEHDRSKKSDSNHLEKHQDNANLEENDVEPIVDRNNCQKQVSIACSICSETFAEIRYLIEHLHLHERESLLHSEQNAATCEQPNLGANDSKDKCFEKRNSDEHSPALNVSNEYLPALIVDEILNDTQEEKIEGRAPYIVKISSNSTQSTPSTKLQKNPHKCKVCEKTFAHLYLLRKHTGTHKDERSNSRPKGGKGFQQKSNVKQDILAHSKEIPCPKCPKVFKNKGCLTLHLRNHNKLKKGKQNVLNINNKVSDVEGYPENTEILICEVNPEIIASQENVLENGYTPVNRLNEFSENAKEKKIIQTDIHISNVERKALEDHHSTTNTFSCGNCKKIFVGEKPQTCDNCKRKFSEQSKLELIPVNLKPHSNEKQLEKEFGSVITRSMHAGKRFKCIECEQSFKSWPNLKQHILSHKKKKPFSCKECGKAFRDRYGLRRHLPTHSDEEQYARIKMKRLKEPALNADDEKMKETNIQISNIEVKTLEKHSSTTNISCEGCKKIFVGKKPRACDNCHLEFTKSDTTKVTNEMKRHSNNNYLGEVRGKNFKSRKAPSNHRQGHFEEKLFKCKVCEKSFLKSSTLNRHLLLHSSETTFSCKDCGVSFSQERLLTRHLTGISLIHLTAMEKKRLRRKVVIKPHFGEYSETAASKESNENQISDVDEVQHPPTKNTFSCKTCQKEFVGEKPTACDKCQTEIPDEPCLDVAAGNLPNKRIEKPTRDVCSNETIFKCFFCPRSFSRINCLQVHVLCHSAERVTCGLCGSIFKSTRNLVKHLPLHTCLEKNHKCDLCGKSFLTKFYLDCHLRAHSGLTPYLCEVCGKSYKKKLDLLIHLEIHSSEESPQSINKPFECELCHKGFFARWLLNKHRCEAASSRHPQGKCSCDVCGKEVWRDALKRHLLSHSTDKPFKCEVCDKSYKSKYELKCHQKVHSGEEPYSCSVCGKKFASMRLLGNHRRQHNDPESFACKFCPKSFKVKSTLESHIRTHTGEKPFTCDVCQKSFRQTSTLNVHRRIHTGVKSFVCEQCSKGFYTVSDLRKHRRICNREEKPFVCEICQKGFRNGSGLTVHRRHHTGEKPFVCKVCNKSFRLCVGLQRHMRMHTGEKPYRCDVCQKRFTLRCNLKIHLRTHNREAPVSSDHTDDPPASTGVSYQPHVLQISKSSGL